jgi:hypothetical protein
LYSELTEIGSIVFLVNVDDGFIFGEENVKDDDEEDK